MIAAVPGAEWWTVLGAALVTAGAGVQAYREFRAFGAFYDAVVLTADAVVAEQVRALAARTRIWQFWRRRAIRAAAAREGEQLLTAEERDRVHDIDLRALGWALVTGGGAVTTGAAVVTALSS